MNRMVKIILYAGVASTLEVALYLLLPNYYPLYLLPPLAAGVLIGLLSGSDIEWILASGLTSLSPQMFLAMQYTLYGFDISLIYRADLAILVPTLLGVITLLSASNLVYVLKRIGVINIGI